MVEVRLKKERVLTPEIVIMFMLAKTTGNEAMEAAAVIRFTGRCLYDVERDTFLTEDESIEHFKEIGYEATMALVDEVEGLVTEEVDSKRLDPFKKSFPANF